MKKAHLLISYLLLILILATCAPAVAPTVPTPAPQAAAPAPKAPVPVVPAKPAWQVEWDRTVQAAKGEGTVVVVTTNAPEVVRAVAKTFKSEFGISIEFLAGRPAELGVRVVNERRAKIYSIDAGLIGFSTPYLQLKPVGALESFDKVLFLPELTNSQEIQRVWRTKKLEWVDKEHAILGFAPQVVIPLVVNTNLVKPGEIKGYRDLLNSKWKGTMVLQDPTLGTGEGSTWVQPVGTRIMGWDYMRKLTEQQPFITRDPRLLVEWIARGKYAVGIAPKKELIKEFMDVGAPIQPLLPEEGSYTGSTGATVNLIKDAPHPNAMKLFVNWLLSKEGQTVFCKSLGAPSGRIDVPAEGVLSATIPEPGKSYFRTDTEEALLVRAEAVKVAREVFAPLTK